MSGKTVFVVHGRNELARRAVFGFLRALGLQPIEWSQALNQTGVSPTIEGVLSKVIPSADGIVVLLTGDDEVALRADLAEDAEETTTAHQARPNVLFEAGMAFAAGRRKTVFVQLGVVKEFSDLGGVFVHRITDQPDSLRRIVGQLREAGLDIDDAGTDWMDTSMFEAARNPPRTLQCMEIKHRKYVDKWLSRAPSSRRNASRLASARVGDVMEDRSSCLVRRPDDEGKAIMHEIERRLALKGSELPFAAIVDSVENYGLKGVITPSDLIVKEKFERYTSSKPCAAQDLWTPDPYKLKPDQTWKEAEAFRAEAGIKSGLPVVDDGGRFIGWMPPRAFRDHIAS